MSPTLSKPQKRLLMIFGSIFVVILLLVFLNPIRSEKVDVEETNRYNLAEGTSANYRIRFQQGDKIHVNFTIESYIEEDNTSRNIDILFLDDDNFELFNDGLKPELIEKGSKRNTSRFSADFELTEQGVYHLVLDNTNMFTPSNREWRSFSDDRAQVSLEIRIEKTQSIISIPEMIEYRSQTNIM